MTNPFDEQPEDGRREPTPTPGDPAGEPGAAASGTEADDLLAEAGIVVEKEISELAAEISERTEDLKRLQAEYVNYRKRVERDREQATIAATRGVIDALTPVLDDIQAAREYGHLEGPFAQIANKLEDALTRFGWERYGAVGDHFDPTIHEALTVHQPAEADAEQVAAAQAQAPGPVITMVMQPGYRVGDWVLRPARVAVSET